MSLRCQNIPLIIHPMNHDFCKKLVIDLCIKTNCWAQANFEENSIFGKGSVSSKNIAGRKRNTCGEKPHEKEESMQ
jgi:hypothetical protein